jgi:hypothetical protein
LLKSLKNKNAKTEDEMFDLVTCQADKRVVCEPIATSEEELGESPATAEEGGAHVNESPLKWLGLGEGIDSKAYEGLSRSQAEELREARLELPLGLKAGSVVSITSGQGKYCNRATLICNSNKPEPYTVVDAGGGYAALVSGLQHPAPGDVPEKAKMQITDAKNGKVTLKLKSGKYCSASLKHSLSCLAQTVGTSEKFILKTMSSATSSKRGNSCKTTSTLKAQALCPFSPELWNLGATCISNHVHGDTHPQCPDGTSAKDIASIKAQCRKAKTSDDNKCSRLGMSY